MRRPGSWALAIALALFGACGGDKTTALDIKLDVTGAEIVQHNEAADSTLALFGDGIEEAMRNNKA